MARFTEPVDCFALEDWQQSEIYDRESYLEMHNGDIVLNETENMLEWMYEHAVIKIAERRN